MTTKMRLLCGCESEGYCSRHGSASQQQARVALLLAMRPHASHAERMWAASASK